MKLQLTTTIMGGKHTLPRCQHYKAKQCGKPAQKGKRCCSTHQSIVEAANRATGWMLMREQAKASVRKFFGQEYRAWQRKIARAVD